MKPSIGRILHYVLTQEDVDRIESERRRVVPSRRGNPISSGEHVPFIVTAVWPNEYGENVPGVNGQAVLDGDDSLWVTSIAEGTMPGTWHWPEREVEEVSPIAPPAGPAAAAAAATKP